MKALEIRGLVHEFNDLPVLRDINLSVAPGEVHALIGFNGAGKSTLMRAALGMLRPDAGTVHLFGGRLAGADTAVWGRVGHLIDTPFVYPDLSVQENLWAAARLHGVPISEVTAAVNLIVTELELEPWAQRRANTLSLGNRQRVGLASALVHRPQLLVLDEPTNALDPSGVVLLRELLLSAASDGAAVLVSSHHLDEVARIADRVSVIHAGAIIGELDPHGVDLERAFFAMIHAADHTAQSVPNPTTKEALQRAPTVIRPVQCLAAGRTSAPSVLLTSMELAQARQRAPPMGQVTPTGPVVQGRPDVRWRAPRVR